ncbi:Calx-beta domain-containing protein [Micromonosporaceae bacterium Da 78-11]
MRYSQAHAAKSGSVPFALRGPKSVRMALATAVAGAIGFMPVVLNASPALADIAGYSIDPTSRTVTEGSDLVFTLTRASADAALSAQTLTWTAEGNSDDDAPAEPTDDFTASGTVEFAADTTSPYGPQTGKVTIHTVNDTMDEANESLTVTITAPNDDTITVTGTITDNDAAPTYKLVVDEPSPDEASGSVYVSAKLDAPSGKTVVIPISTADLTGAGSAKAEQDYTPLEDTVLTVQPLDTESDSQPITITDDPLYEEPKQSFSVKATPTSADVTTATVTGSQTATVGILDNEDQPEINIAANAAAEGTALEFPVTLSGPSERAVTAAYATADGPGSDLTADDIEGRGTATGGSDYTAGTGTVTFPAVTVNEDWPERATSQTVTVRTTNDSAYEGPEDMHVTLSSPTIAKLGDDSVVTGGISSEDAAPTVSLLPISRKVIEGSGGRKAATFTVKLDRASGTKINVGYSATEDAALEGQDFIATSGKVTFNPGETQKTFTVDIIGDTMFEGDETFKLALSSSTAIVTGLDDVDISITDDDKAPSLTFASTTMKEGNEGSVVQIPVKLSGPLGVASTYDVEVVVGTATATGASPGQIDYVAPADELTIPAGQTTGYVYFFVNGDDVYESDEQFGVKVTATAPVDDDMDPIVTGGPKTATVKLTNDDAVPSLDIVNTTGAEGEDVQLYGLTNGVSQHSLPVTVSLRGGSVAGSIAATATDFTDPGALSAEIPGGAFSGVRVPIGEDPIELTDDTTKESDETIVVSGTGVVATVTPGTLTILANDGGNTTTPPPATGTPTISVPANILGAVPVPITGKAAVGATVQLWGAPTSAANSPVAKLAEVTVGATGAYSFSRWIDTGYRFQVAVGDWKSDVKSVTVTQNPVFVVSSPSAGMVSLAVQGNPRAAGQTVFVQRWANGGWVNTWRGVTGSDNLWKAMVKQPSKSAWTLRAFVAGDTPTGIMPGFSASKSITVK